MPWVVQRDPGDRAPLVGGNLQAGEGPADMTGRRVDGAGSWIDRGSPVTFMFDGRAVQGFAGDTVASALLASGEVGGFISPIAGRPRGVYAAGVEEPNAFVEIAEPWFEPIRLA